MGQSKVIQFEVVGKDQKALQRYYANLFGWTFDTSFTGGYGMTDPGDTAVTVGVGSAPEGSPGHVTGYIGVPDIDAALARATELGGSIVMPKFSPGGDATIALIADPEGHVVGLTEMGPA